MINGAATNSFAINSSGSLPSIDASIVEGLGLSDSTPLGFLMQFDESNSDNLNTIDHFYNHNILYTDLLTRILAVTHTEFVSRTYSFFEAVQISNPTIITDVIYGLGDIMEASDTVTTSASLNAILTSNITLDDVILIIFNESILEDVGITHTQSLYQIFLNKLVDILNTSDTTSSQLVAVSQLALSIVIADILLFGVAEEILEDISITHASTELLLLLSKLIDNVTVTLSSTDSIVFISSLAENFTTSDSLSNQANLMNSLLDSMSMVVINDDGDIYSGWVLSPETFAIWNYDNYNFNSMATLGGTTFLANSIGLFEMGGSLDDTAFIESRLKTAAFDFGTSNLKQVPDMYIAASITGELVVGVTTDERINVKYKLKKPTIVSEIQTIKIGKGLRGSLWQFELIDDKCTELEITSLEWIPIVFGRKRR